jgi:hypothetical protein
MALGVVTLTNEVAALSISGIQIYKLSEIKDIFYSRDLPALFPDVDLFYGPIQAVQNSFKGSQNRAMWTTSRTFNYLLLYAEIGQGRGIADFAEGLAIAQDNILTALITADFSECQVTNVVMGNAAVIKHGTAQYIGLEIGITVQELINL